MSILNKQFSREKSLVYFSMWDRSDRAGYELYAGYRLQNNLFFVPAQGEKGQVYYSDKEWADLFRCIGTRFKADSTLWTQLKTRLDTHWDVLLDYFESGTLKTEEDFLGFFHHLTEWWTAMTIAFFVPDVAGIGVHAREEALGFREKGEKFTEKAERLFVEFCRTHFSPDVSDLVMVLTPEEAVAIIRGEASNDVIHLFRERLKGYGLFNQIVYLSKDLPDVLKAAGVSLEEVKIDPSTPEVRGTCAQMGKASGVVRVVVHKKDLDRVYPGDVIVAEMTNPDYVPWMNIAAAFVTDEGGMTCHAGIVARELGKPCVVGTKIGTRVFKDGEMVEVDATNGVVRRLS